MIRTACSILVAVAVVGFAREVRAECRASASGAFSIRVRVSPLAGIRCLYDVSLYSGATCGPEDARWTATFPCSETRMVVTDRGTLVSLVSARPRSRRWDVVRIFERAADEWVVRSVRFGELPGLPVHTRRPRLKLDAGALHVLLEPELTVPIATLVGLGRITEHRRLRGL